MTKWGRVIKEGNSRRVTRPLRERAPYALEQDRARRAAVGEAVAGSA